MHWSRNGGEIREEKFRKQTQWTCYVRRFPKDWKCNKETIINNATVVLLLEKEGDAFKGGQGVDRIRGCWETCGRQRSCDSLDWSRCVCWWFQNNSASRRRGTLLRQPFIPKRCQSSRIVIYDGWRRLNNARLARHASGYGFWGIRQSEWPLQTSR